MSDDLPGSTAGDWQVSDFDYELPPELIAQEPLIERTASRLLIVRPGATTFPETTVRALGDWLHPGDLLVANNSRVIPARIFARKELTGGQVELLLLRQDETGAWIALAKPARRLRPGLRLVAASSRGVSDSTGIMVEEIGRDGEVRIRFEEGSIDLDRFGEMPLPPYITTRLDDQERYQTVYADDPGSAAAPTAGLHFTSELIDSLWARGIGWTDVTLHVGLDTFRPVAVERVADHHIHREWCAVSNEAAGQIAATRARGGRIVAIGTTAARTLETLGQTWNEVDPKGFTGESDLFITPGYDWKIVDGLLTNFHLPRSTLLMMVSALAGMETIRLAYATAVDRAFRFYSFGDAMLILPGSARC